MALRQLFGRLRALITAGGPISGLGRDSMWVLPDFTAIGVAPHPQTVRPSPTVTDYFVRPLAIRVDKSIGMSYR